MVLELWDYVNSLYRKLRGDASGRAVTLPEGQYLATPGTLDDEEYHHLTLTVDKKLRVDDPTTQEKVDDIEDKLDHVDHGLAALKALIDTAQTDLDNPAQYKADVSALALEATLTAIKGSGWTVQTLVAIYNFLGTLLTRLSATRAGYLDQLDFTLQENIAALQTDLDNPAQYKADLSTLESRLSSTRAGYLDQLDFTLQENIAALQTDLDNPAQYKDKADLTTLESRISATRAAYFDQLDFNLQEKLVEIDGEVEGLAGAAMRGTDLALLAANYEAEVGTDNALLAANYKSFSAYYYTGSLADGAVYTPAAGTIVDVAHIDEAVLGAWEWHLRDDVAGFDLLDSFYLQCQANYKTVKGPIYCDGTKLGFQQNTGGAETISLYGRTYS